MHATPRIVRRLAALALAPACLALSACSTLERANAPLYPLPQVTAAQMVSSNQALAAAWQPPSNGSIFQNTAYRPLYEDYRARMVGDILTITISEVTSATATANDKVQRTGSVSGSITALPILPAALGAKLGAGGSGSNVHEGKGETVNTNNFTGTITATVIGVLPNGHLLVRGEKQIGVNTNVDTLQFTGQVDPRSILPGNTIASSQVASVRLQQSGRGAQADAQSMGWMQRFFLNLLPI